MNILVSEPNRDGESEHTVLCDQHLDAALHRRALATGEYVIAADPDVDCAECDGCDS